ncbi:hypothetical protein GJ631_10770 [Natronomonas sp. CBA1123]|uniref:DUF7289 family protein n=1 Tax=Natronomonas sp. CBA1123 TaxID=2668070 RepID=UPI0012EA629A|nr:hypothetical protein [Natronomonas sp. CBA1123]MUV87037.1 hypothetical protein [Natronomonas sp. CBA1123]
MGIINGDRGQSEVVGAILLFGIFILALGLLQAYFVPQEISATEQNHVEEVSSDFTEMYASIGDAAGSNRERSASLSLGTRYGVSTVFLTPPPAQGTIESESVGSLSSENGNEFSDLDGPLVEELCGLDDVETKAITYEARYNEYRNAASHTYEAGVHYRMVDSAGLRNSQRLVDEGEDVTTIHLVPITHGSIRESGISREPITFIPGGTAETAPFAGDSSDPVTIRIPIQNQAGWDATFDGSVVSTTANTALLELDDDSETYRVRCTPVGINTAPDNSPSSEFRGDTENDDEDTGAFNPIGNGALILQEGSTAGQLNFENTAISDKTVTQVRIPWILNPGQNTDEFELDFMLDSSTITVETGSTTWTDTGGWTWEDETDVSGSEKSIGVDGGGGDPNTGYGIVFKFEDGTTETYLVSGSNGGNNNNNGNGNNS